MSTPRDFFRSLTAPAIVPGVESGGIPCLNLNLADLSVAAGKPYSQPGYGIYFPQGGNPAGARLDLDFGGGTRLTDFAPGDVLSLAFKGFTARLNALSATAGVCKLYVFAEPGNSYNSLGSDVGGNVGDSTNVGPGGTTVQAANSTGNVPTAAGDGVSLVGVDGLRVLVAAQAGATMSAPGGTTEVRWWLYLAHAGGYAWALSEESWIPSRSGVRGIVSPDFAHLVKTGAERAYPEVLSWAASAGDLVVSCARYGRIS